MMGEAIAVVGFLLALRATNLIRKNDSKHRQDDIMLMTGSSLVLCLLGFLLS